MLSYWLLIQKNISQAITYHKLPTLPVPTLLIVWTPNEMENVGHIPFIEIEQLRGQLGVEPKQYKIISNFKLRVLDVAVEQVNQHSDYTIKYEQHKQGADNYRFFIQI